jgi:hypothetical protein
MCRFRSARWKKGEGQGLNAQAKIEPASQGIPFGQFVQTQLGFPPFWRSLSLTKKGVNYGNL